MTIYCVDTHLYYKINWIYYNLQYYTYNYISIFLTVKNTVVFEIQ